ncbi:DUF4044 domain-containing protein [Caenorhabditis elegans]|uniref:DUF4044 domain-containing protein n=1 Tax=Caenorhabditis elegans TaxID=6239 RepID=C7FZT5_CAEEL|nr:DUF4044 domain-containing protein [Caenorhabditis elegans]CCD61199.1 DUF4044 domain-containing protein [Caenorhabditis elegans]|eukprot:NP_001250062.1 Uncharacterized protein CELE_B0025.5 [Caenorhabditis elegans]
MYAASETMSIQEHDNHNVSSIRRMTAGGKKKKRTAHFKKRGHPVFKIMFIVFSLLAILSIIMACVATAMMVMV